MKKCKCSKKHYFMILTYLMLVLAVCCIPSVRVQAADGKLDAAALAQLQSRFPEDAYWNHLCTDPNTTRSETYQDSVTKNVCTHTEHNGYYDCNHFDGTGQCWGFARKMAYEYFGVKFSGQPTTKNINELKAGDIVRYQPGTVEHSIWVTGVSGETVYFADCNFEGPCQIRWDGVTTKSAIRASLCFIEQAPDHFYGLLDYPSRDSNNITELTTEEAFTFSGWAIDRSTVAKVAVYVNGREYHCSQYERTDPGIRQYGYPTGKEGFKVVIPVKDLKEGDNPYTVKAYTGSRKEYQIAQGIIRIPRFKISASSLTMYAKGTKTLTAQVGDKKVTPTWKTSNSSVVSVSNSGKLTAKKAGTATITAIYEELKATCSITVKNPSIKLNKTSLSLKVPGNYTYQIQADVIGKSKKVIWKSSDPTVATVSSSGKVTAKDTGKVNILATANGVVAKCVVKVENTTVKEAYRNYTIQNKNSSNDSPRKSGSLYFFADKIGERYGDWGSVLRYSKKPSGPRSVITSLNSDERFEWRFVTNGTNIYYSVRKNGSSTATVYVFNLQTKTKKTVCTYQISYGDFCGYYDGKIYLRKDKPCDDIKVDITSYDVKTKKYKIVVKDARNFIQYGRYFVVRNAGDEFTFDKLYIYNASTGKKTTISNYAIDPIIYNGKLYYVESNDWIKVSLKCSNLTGTSVKSIASMNVRKYPIIESTIGPKYAIISTDFTAHTKITYSTKKKSVSNSSEVAKLRKMYPYDYWI